MYFGVGSSTHARSKSEAVGGVTVVLKMIDRGFAIVLVFGTADTPSDQ
jgi:hypothetical protein